MRDPESVRRYNARYNQSEAGRERKRRWKLKKYDTDAIWRQETLMKDNSRRRKQSLKRRKEQLASEPAEFLTILQ